MTIAVAEETQLADPLAGPVVFCYDFPHWKSQMFLLHLMRMNIRPSLVIGAPRLELYRPERSVRTTLYASELEHPAALAKAIGAEYVRHAHTADLAHAVLSQTQCHVGLIAGARILPSEIISRFSIGVLNLHPSILPGNRGLDSWLWDIQQGRPLGVTAHLIDARIDCGRLVATRTVTARDDETLPEIWFRLLSAQTRLLDEAFTIVARCDPRSLQELGRTNRLPGQMPDDMLRDIATRR